MPSGEKYTVEYIYSGKSLTAFDKMLKRAQRTAKSMDRQMRTIGSTYDKMSSSTKKMTLAMNQNNKASQKYKTSSGNIVKTNRQLTSSNLSAADSFKRAAAQNARSAALLKAQGQKIKGFGEDVTSVGRTMTMFSAATFAAFAGMIKSGKDFETQFAGVTKTVSDGTPAMTASIQNFRNEILGMLKELPIASEELNSIAEIGGQMGIPIQNLRTFTEVIAKLGIATNITGEEGAEMIGKFLNIMDLKPTERNMREFGDVIVALGNAMNGTEQDILQLANRLSGAASMIKMSQKETLALSSAMAAVGIRAEMGGGAFQRVSIQIQDYVDEGGAGLAKLAKIANMTSAEFVKSWKSKPLDAFMAFEKGIRDAGDQGSAVFRSMFKNNTRDLQMVLKLANGYEQLVLAKKTANQAALEGGNLTRESNIRFQTMDSKIQLLKNSFTTLSVAMTDKFGDEIKGIIGNVTDFVQNATNWVSSLDADSVKTITTLGLLAAGIGPVTLAFGGFLKVAGQVKIVRGSVMSGLNFMQKSFAKTGKTAKVAGVGTETFIGNLLRIPQMKYKVNQGVTFVKNQFENLALQMSLANGIGQKTIAFFTSGLPMALGVGAIAIGAIGLAWYLSTENMRRARDMTKTATDTMVNSWNAASKGSQALNTTMANISRTSQNVAKDITLLSTVIRAGDTNYRDYVNNVNDANTTLIESSKKVIDQRLQDTQTLIAADSSLTAAQKKSALERESKVYGKDTANLEKIRVAWQKAFASGNQTQMIKVSQQLNKELERQGILTNKSADSFVLQAKRMRDSGVLTTETQKKLYGEAAEAINASLAEVQSAYVDVMSNSKATAAQIAQANRSMEAATKKAFTDMAKVIGNTNNVDLSPFIKTLKNGYIEYPEHATAAMKRAIDEMNAYLEKMPDQQKEFLNKTVDNWSIVFKDGFNTFFLGGKDVTSGLVAGVSEGFAGSVEQMRKKVTELGLVFDEKQKLFTFKGVSLGNNIFKGLDKGLPAKKLKAFMDARLSLGTKTEIKNGQAFYKGYNLGDQIFKGINMALPENKLVPLLEARIKEANSASLTEAQKNQTGTQIAENITEQVKAGKYAEAMRTAQRLLKFSEKTGSKEGTKVAENIIKKLENGDYKGAMEEVDKALKLPKGAGSIQGANWGNNFMFNLPKAIQDILAGKTPGKGSILERDFGKNFDLDRAKMAQDIANKIMINSQQPRPEYNQYVSVQTKDVTTVSSLTKIKQRAGFLQ